MASCLCNCMSQLSSHKTPCNLDFASSRWAVRLVNLDDYHLLGMHKDPSICCYRANSILTPGPGPYIYRVYLIYARDASLCRRIADPRTVHQAMASGDMAVTAVTDAARPLSPMVPIAKPDRTSWSDGLHLFTWEKPVREETPVQTPDTCDRSY